MRPVTVVCLMGCVLLAAILLAGHIPAARAASTIYIRQDGSIEPSTANITSTDNVLYTFTGNNWLPIRVERGNIILDGAGYTLQAGSGNIGIRVDKYTEEGPEISGAGNVTIQNLIIKGCYYAVYLVSTDGNKVLNNIVTENAWGAFLDYSRQNVIVGNTIFNNTYGIYMQGIGVTGRNDISRNDIVAQRHYALRIHSPTNNSIYDNNIVDNDLDHYSGASISISGGSRNNVFYHNNIVGEGPLVYIEVEGYANAWDSGGVGNFWSDYEGQDANSDGIGDTSYNITSANVDHYPLVSQIGVIRRTYAAYSKPIILASTSTVSGFEFDGAAKTISFAVTGVAGTPGSCNITFLNEMLGGPYTVQIDGTPITPVTTSNATHTTLALTYTHSTHMVEVLGTTAIPEFPALVSATLLMAMLTMVLLLTRKTRGHRLP